MRSNILLLLLTFFCWWVTPAFGEIIFQDDFNNYNNSITEWYTGSNIYLQETGGINNSQCAQVHYDRSGTSPYWFSKNISEHKLNEIYVRFYFKVDNPSGGSKFLKLFGERDAPIGYANTTFMINYINGQLWEVSYGDGSSTINDTQSVIRYSGKHTDANVTIVESTEALDIADGEWHCFEAHMRYNMDGKRDGIYRVWVDNNLLIHAINVKNRNDQNSMYFHSVDLANYCSNYFESPWNLWYDNVVISTERIGCNENINSQEPSLLIPPTGLKILTEQK